MMHEIPTMGITHAGVFHADDVFAAAFLKVINPEIKFYRVNNSKDAQSIDGWDLPTTVVFDVGGGEFDHHTPECAESRPHAEGEQEFPYAAFGKVVRGYYDHLMDEDDYNKFDIGLCLCIDYHDTCGHMPGVAFANPLSSAISVFNLSWDEPASPADWMAAFMTAVEMAETIIQRFLHRMEANKKSEVIFNDALQKMQSRAEGRLNKPHVLVLEKYCNYAQYVRDYPDIWFVVYPSLRGGYQLFSVSGADKINRCLIDEEIAKLIDPTNPKHIYNHASFCHVARFTAGFDTVEDALLVGEISSLLKEAEDDESKRELILEDFDLQMS